MANATDRLTHRIISELVLEDPSYADIVEQFVGGLSERIDEMENAIRAADFETLRISAHRLKGSGGGYGYAILSEHAADLERHAASQSADACRTALEQLREVVDRIAVGPND
jgi:HPt (histidine-containing phosphotransfer) domain-containing protein